MYAAGSEGCGEQWGGDVTYHREWALFWGAGLEVLALDHNKLQGTLPYDFLEEGAVEQVYLGHNLLTGKLQQHLPVLHLCRSRGSQQRALSASGKFR